jgi:hypothetical protein
MGISENPKVLAERMRTLAEAATHGHSVNDNGTELFFEVSEFMDNFNQVRSEARNYLPSSVLLSFGC